MATPRLPLWGWALSVGAHVGAVALALWSARAPAAIPPPRGEQVLIDVDAEGAPAGGPKGEVTRGASAHKPVAARAARDDDGDDGYLPRRKRHAKHDDDKRDLKDEKAEKLEKVDKPDAKADEDDKKKAEAAAKDAERDALREAVKKAMLSPEGAADAKGEGAGKGDGKGTGGTGKKAGVSSKYAGMLDGWFSGRVSLRGLNMPWEELKTMSTVVTIQLTPDRHVSGFSIAQGSGNPAYDARVQSSMQAVVSSGATLPAPPEDEDIPAQITLRFRCRTQERCS